MRRTLIGLAVGLVLPLSVAHADVTSDLKAGLPLQTVLLNAVKAKQPIDMALRQVLDAEPEQSSSAIAAALQLNPDQAASIVAAALDKHFNLNPSQVVGAALQGAPDKAGIIISTAIVKSPSYYTVPIVQRALNDGVEGAKFLPPAMRTAPRQSDSILTQALISAPEQTEAIMRAVIAAQPDKTLEYVRVALDAKAPAKEVLTAAFAVSSRQAEDITSLAKQKSVPLPTIVAASKSAGVTVASLSTSDKSGPGNSSSLVGGTTNTYIAPINAPNLNGGGGGASPN